MGPQIPHSPTVRSEPHNPWIHYDSDLDEFSPDWDESNEAF